MTVPNVSCSQSPHHIHSPLNFTEQKLSTYLPSSSLGRTNVYMTADIKQHSWGVILGCERTGVPAKSVNLKQRRGVSQELWVVMDWPSGSVWRQFFLMLSSRKPWSLPTWAGSAWISLQLTSCKGRQSVGNGITLATGSARVHMHRHTYTPLTSSISSLDRPISSGMDTSLLLLTSRTLRGRLNRYFGRTDRRFRLGIKRKQWPTLYTAHNSMEQWVSGRWELNFSKRGNASLSCEHFMPCLCSEMGNKHLLRAKRSTLIYSSN